MFNKILLSVLLLFFTVTCVPAQTAHAEPIGGLGMGCTCKDSTQSPDYTCTSMDGFPQNLKCEGDKKCVTSVEAGTIECVDNPTQQNKQIKCSCQNPGKPGSGNNGITCEDEQGKLGVTIWCHPESYACVSGPDKSMKIGAESKILEKDYEPYDLRFKGRVVQNVKCVDDAGLKKTKGVQCTCENPNQPEDGKNGFSCKGENGKDYKMWCGDHDQACIPDPQGNYVLDSGAMKPQDGFDNDDFNDNMRGYTARNIKCESEKDRENRNPFPTQPPPVPPPCKGSMDASGQCDSFNTAFGVMNTDAPRLTTSLFAILLSFSGGLALLLIIRSGYTLITSQGNPQKVQEGRDQLVAAIVGLVFLVFSFVLLQLIGYDILRIPGWGDGGNGTVNSRVNGG